MMPFSDVTFKILLNRGVHLEMVPFEYQGNDKVRVYFYSPVTFLPRRIRLWIVR